MGALAEIVSVDTIKPLHSGLTGGNVELPAPTRHVSAQGLTVAGWVLGATAAVQAVEFVEGDRVLWRVPVDVARLDLANAFPDVGWAGRAGFVTTVDVTGRSRELGLQLRAVLPDHTRIPFAEIRLLRTWRERVPGKAALVSVVIPCYNQAHFLGEAIESVLAQTHPHHEIVVVDDGSTDDVQSVVARYPGVRCIHQPNAGLSAARNAGIRRSNGDYLVFLDADDRLLPEALEIGLDDLRNFPHCAFVYGHYQHVDLDGSPLPTPPVWWPVEDHYWAMLRTNHVGMPASALYRREVFEHVTGFGQLTPCADYDLSLRIASQFPIHSHGRVVAEYRQHGSNMSRDQPKMLAAALTALRGQHHNVEHDPALCQAYDVGVKFWRALYGDPLARDVAAQIRKGRWLRAVRGITALARHHRRGLLLAALALPKFGRRATRSMALPSDPSRQAAGNSRWPRPLRRSRRQRRIMTSFAERITPAGVRDGFAVAAASNAALGAAATGAGERMWDWVHTVGPVAYEELAEILPPVPPIELRRITTGADPVEFLRAGLLHADLLLSKFERHWEHQGPATILDFGCGCGRICRYLAMRPDLWTVHACDVNPAHVAWLEQHLPMVHPICSPLDPPLPFDVGQFDLVYALSVFSHLPEERAEPWLAELHRVLKPGGLLIVTTHGLTALDKAAASPSHANLLNLGQRSIDMARAELQSSGIVYSDYSTENAATAAAGPQYGSAVVTLERLTHWAGSELEVVERDEGGLDSWQDVTVLKTKLE